MCYNSGLCPYRPHNVGDEPGQRCRGCAHHRAQLVGREILGILTSQFWGLTKNQGELIEEDQAGSLDKGRSLGLHGGV